MCPRILGIISWFDEKTYQSTKKFDAFCEIAKGYMNSSNKINKLKTERASLNEIAKFIGFE